VFDGVRADGQAEGRLVQFRDRHDGVRGGVGIAERLGCSVKRTPGSLCFDSSV